MHALPLDPKKKQKEWKTIQTIAKNNNIPQQLLQKLNQRVQQKTDQNPEKKDKKIWTTFTYHSPKIRTITNLFKNTNINIAFRTTTTTQQYLKQKKHTPTPEYEKVEYTKSHATHAIRRMSDKLAVASKRDTRNIQDI